MTLTAAQHSTIERRLDTCNGELRRQISAAMPEIADQSFTVLAGSVYDAGDEATATMIEELSHTQLRRYVGELRQIEKARQRLAEGDIDECVECGEEIGYRRLHAHPVATRCIQCQTRHERTFGTHALGLA